MNQHNMAATQEEPEEEKAVNFSYFTRMHCGTNGYENQLSNKIRFPQHRLNISATKLDPRWIHSLIKAKTQFGFQWKLQSMLLWCLSSPKTKSNCPMFLSLWMTIDSIKNPFTLLLTRERPCQNISWLRVALQAESINTNLNDVHYLPTRHGR